VDLRIQCELFSAQRYARLWRAALELLQGGHEIRPNTPCAVVCHSRREILRCELPEPPVQPSEGRGGSESPAPVPLDVLKEHVDGAYDAIVTLKIGCSRCDLSRKVGRQKPAIFGRWRADTLRGEFAKTIVDRDEYVLSTNATTAKICKSFEVVVDRVRPGVTQLPQRNEIAFANGVQLRLP
jgi:hypothetical protein